MAALNVLAALYIAVPWGALLHALSFEAMGVAPPMVHTLVGDTIWQECWGERHGRVNHANMVPFKLSNILKWITEQSTLQMLKNDLAEGEARYKAVKTAADTRRRNGSPY